MSNCNKSRRWLVYYMAVVIFAVVLTQDGETHGQISGFISSLLSGG